VVIRPSGTEPKVKAYLEVVEPVESAEALADARAKATDRMTALRTEVTKLLDR
jgi:phosphomannomutase